VGKSLAAVYLIYGDEPLLLQEAADAVRGAARTLGYGERECLNVDAVFDWNMLMQTANSPSLFATRRLIELRLGNAKPGKLGAEAMKAYAARPAEGTVLLVLGAKFDAATQRSQWVAALDRAGVLVQVRAVGADKLSAWIERRMHESELQPNAEALAVIADRTEGNLLAAAQEIEKLRILCGPGPVGAKQILDAVGDSARYTLYDLVDAALDERADRATRSLGGLRDSGMAPALVLWALHREVRLLNQLAFDVTAGIPPQQALSHNNVWERRKPLLTRVMRRAPLHTCRSLLRDCAAVDRLVKGVDRGDCWGALLAVTLRLAGFGVLADCGRRAS
jgi:DNA polymerase-3 subunit delta